MVRKLTGCAVLMAVAMTAPISADSEGFIDNWTGNVKIELRALGASGPPVTTSLPVGTVFEPLSAQVTTVWRDAQSDGKICNQIRTRFVETGRVSKWLMCNVAASGELRARMLPGNVLDLKYVLTGNRVRFEAVTPDGLPGALDPTLQVDFDIELRLRLEFEAAVNGDILPKEFEDKPVPPRRDPNGAPYLVKPARLTKPVLSFARSRVTASGLLSAFISDSTLRDVAARVNATTAEPETDKLGIAEINRRLHKGTRELASLIQALHPELGIPAPSFGLSVLINADRDLVIQYQRFGNPPLPLPGCRCDSRCDDKVNCICAGAGLVTDTERFFLQRQRADGSWMSAGVGDTFSVTGDAFGARTGDTLSYRMCRTNQFGSRCTDPVSFVYKEVGACSVGGGGGRTGPRAPLCAPNCPR